MWSDKPYNAKSDIWSLGCVIYEAAALHPPFMAKDMRGLYQKVMAGAFTNVPKSYSKEFAELTRLLLQRSASARPSCGTVCGTVEEILELPAVKVKAKDEVEMVNANQAMATGEMLGTIALPKNLSALASCLPKPNYESTQKTNKKAATPETSTKFESMPTQQFEPSRRVIGMPPPPIKSEERKATDAVQQRIVLKRNMPIRIREPYRLNAEERKVMSSQQPRQVEQPPEQMPGDNYLHRIERRINSSQEPKRIIIHNIPLLEQVKPSTKQQEREPIILPHRAPYFPFSQQ